MKKCPLRAERAMETRNLTKRGISDIGIDNTEGALLEPPQKVPRLSAVVRDGHRNIYGVWDRTNGLGAGGTHVAGAG
jgi:hypothetical protein